MDFGAYFEGYMLLPGATFRGELLDMAQGKHDGKPERRALLIIVEIICVIVVIACVALIFMQVSKY